MSNNKTVVITGANGFIGRQALRPLRDAGYRVVAPHIGEPLDEPEGVEWVLCDLLKEDDVSRLFASVRPTHLLHLAWGLGEDFYYSCESFRWVEVGLRVFRNFVDAGGRRAMIEGSCAEYDWRHEHLREDTICDPATTYGLCKHRLHDLLMDYGERAEVEVAWGRVFWLYGPHETPRRLVPAAITGLLKGERAEFTDGLQIRDYLHVEDVAEVNVRILESKLTGAVNIASGIPVQVREIVTTIGAIVGRPELIDLGALPTPPHEVMRVEADVSRLQSLGWKPKYDLRSGLEQTIDWWRHIPRS